jgi:hypothetical protein
MERILNKSRRQTPAIVLIGLALAISIANYRAAAAGPFSGWFTGYAMGNLKGGAGVTLVQGHFANHLNTACPNDPAAQWLYGTRITTSQWIGMKNASGQVVNYNRFYLEDIGDLSCSQGNYWVDIYFGRYKFNANVCSCPGVSNSVCTIANTNSCTQATNFGRSIKSYTSP